MKQNHFYIAYWGNKRAEVINITNNIKFDNIETIIEPYCGSCSMSYYISTLYPKRFKYILNDNDKNLFEMYKIIIDDEKSLLFENTYNELIDGIDKEKYKELIKRNDIYGWFIKYKIYAMRPGMYPTDDRKTMIRKIKLSDYKIYDFFKNEDILYTSEDGLECYKKYNNNNKNIILMDPPYIGTCNETYNDFKLNIYSYLANNEIKNEKANIYLILENNWIINILFKDYKKFEYEKNYMNQKKRKTNHIIIANK
jgi:hypothetical protein